MKRVKMHRIKVRGVGRLAVSGKLPKVSQTVLVAGKRYPITKQAFMEAWALSRHTGRSFRELLAERITEPKGGKLTSLEKFSQEVSFGLGAPVDEGELLNYFERGLSVEQAVNALRADARARVKQKEERVW